MVWETVTGEVVTCKLEVGALTALKNKVASVYLMNRCMRGVRSLILFIDLWTVINLHREAVRNTSNRNQKPCLFD